MRKLNIISASPTSRAFQFDLFRLNLVKNESPLVARLNKRHFRIPWLCSLFKLAGFVLRCTCASQTTEAETSVWGNDLLIAAPLPSALAQTR